ncbi:MFS transporter [Atopococcus tabaci]|uniref:MFS transporter n=1 Tax=Atopococcus tabaci TaxID=269774 RepID=UPI0024094523|nr:MFS transporter [Atopococcus tabaci]
MVFYTEVLGINPNMVGTLFVVARFVDAVSDVVFGKLVDRSKETEAGKFKPWIKRFAGPVALASFLMYQTAMAGAPMTLKVVYMYVTYLLWGSLFYTAINIPYGSTASAISPLFIYTTDEAGNQIVRGGSAFVIVAGMFSLLSLLFYFICYKWTTERVRVTQTGAEDVSLLQSFAQIFKSRSLLAITGASISLLLVMMIQQMNNYIFPFYYGSAAGVSLINFINPLVSLLVAFPLASALA